MEKNEFRVELIVYSDDNHPTTITDITGIEPTEIFVKGEQWYSPFLKKPVPGKFYEENIWIYSTERMYVDQSETLYIDHCLRSLLAILSEKREKFKKIFKEHPSSYIGCYGYYYDSHEYFKLDRAIIADLYDYQIDLVFDSHNFSKDRSDING